MKRTNKLLIALAATALLVPLFAWFADPVNYSHIYIAYVNDVDVRPVATPVAATDGWRFIESGTADFDGLYRDTATTLNGKAVYLHTTATKYLFYTQHTPSATYCWALADATAATITAYTDVAYHAAQDEEDPATAWYCEIVGIAACPAPSCSWQATTYTVASPEAGTVSGPLTVRVVATALTNPLEQVFLQYKETGTGTWISVPIQWTRALSAAGSFSDATIDAYQAYLAHYWKLDEASGNARVDSAGSLDLAELSATTAVAGMDNDAAQVGSGGGSLRGTSSIAAPSSLAVSFWLKNTHDGTYSNLISAIPHLYVGYGLFQFMLDGNGGYPTEPKLIGYVAHTGGNYTAGCVTASRLTAETWYHVFLATLPAEGGSGGTVAMWVDGVQAGAWGSTTYGALVQADGILVRDDEGAGSSSVFDELAIWFNFPTMNATTGEELAQALYASGAGKFYSLGDGSGNWRLIEEMAFHEPECSFGLSTIDWTHYTKGDTFLIRLYVADALYENGDLLVDTTEDGTNGWLDQCVVGGTFHGTNEKPGQPIIEWVPK